VTVRVVAERYDKLRRLGGTGTWIKGESALKEAENRISLLLH
jgi:hypothetical protein